MSGSDVKLRTDVFKIEFEDRSAQKTRTAFVEGTSAHKAVKRLLEFVVDVTEVKKAKSLELVQALSAVVNDTPHDMLVLIGDAPVRQQALGGDTDEDHERLDEPHDDFHHDEVHSEVTDSAGATHGSCAIPETY